MKLLIPLLLLLTSSPAIAYTLIPDGNGGYTYGTGSSTYTINTIEDVNMGNQTTVYKDNVPVQQCTTYRFPGGYVSTSCR